jgi:hypothetical protein
LIFSSGLLRQNVTKIKVASLHYYSKERGRTDPDLSKTLSPHHTTTAPQLPLKSQEQKEDETREISRNLNMNPSFVTEE